MAVPEHDLLYEVPYSRLRELRAAEVEAERLREENAILWTYVPMNQLSPAKRAINDAMVRLSRAKRKSTDA